MKVLSRGKGNVVHLRRRHMFWHPPEDLAKRTLVGLAVTRWLAITPAALRELGGRE